MSSGNEEPSTDKTSLARKRRPSAPHADSSPKFRRTEKKSLQHMPVEILEIIFELCLPVCIQELERPLKRPSKDLVLSLSLIEDQIAPHYEPIVNLCLTSRGCKKISQPLLYRAVSAGGLTRLPKCYESRRLRPDLWQDVVYLSADLRDEDHKVELMEELVDVLAQTRRLQALCLRIHPHDLELEWADLDESDSSDTDGAPVSLLRCILTRLSPQTTVLHIVNEDSGPWLQSLQTILSYFPGSCRMMWSRSTQQHPWSYAVREQSKLEGDGVIKFTLLELKELTGNEFLVAYQLGLYGLNNPDSLAIQVPDCGPGHTYWGLNLLVQRVAPAVRSLRLECSETHNDDERFGLRGYRALTLCASWPLHTVRFSCLTRLTISLQFLVGDKWFTSLEILRIGLRYDLILETGGLSDLCPLLEEFCLVEYCKYLDLFDHDCRQDFTQASSNLAIHHGMLAIFLWKLYLNWAKSPEDSIEGTPQVPGQGRRKVMFKNFTFSPAGWQIAWTVGRVCVDSLLFQPGEAGYEPREDGFFRVGETDHRQLS